MGQQKNQASGTPAPVAGLTAELTGALGAEDSAYASILDLVESQRVALESNDVQALDRVTGAQIEAMSEASRLGRRRQSVAAVLGQALGLSAEDTDLRRLALALPADQARTVGSLGAKLRATLDRIDRASERNKALLVNGLRISQHLLSQMLGAKPTQPVYARDGRVGNPAEHSKLEYRA